VLFDPVFQLEACVVRAEGDLHVGNCNLRLAVTTGQKGSVLRSLCGHGFQGILCPDAGDAASADPGLKGE
jgi:hypothetical protein